MNCPDSCLFVSSLGQLRFGASEASRLWRDCGVVRKWVDSLGARELTIFLKRSRLLIFAKFLKSRITAERVEHWIETEQRRSERYVCGQRAPVGYRE